MSVPISPLEPLSVRAGDTWRWVRDLSDYPAPAWSLVYTLYGPAGVVHVTATADGARHLVDLAPAVTGTYAPGRYDGIAHVTDGTDRLQIWSGAVQVLPDLREATTADGRSHARRMLDAIEATLEGRASAGDLDIVRTQLGDQAVERDPAALAMAHRTYAALVADEDRRAAIGRGQSRATAPAAREISRLRRLSSAGIRRAGFR